jgi:serine/threonine protein kinase
MSMAELTKVGRYEILAKVGQGAMGVVYRAQDPTIRRIVALKVLPADSAEVGGGEPDTRGQSKAGSFEREAQAAGALLHPNIVTLYDAGRDGSWYYLAMEFVEGGTFASEILREGKVKPERAAEVVAVVADALDFAHERGVIHRDIKPANLMILSDQTVKVADFGIARLTSSATMTSDTMVGTPYYMSPEQVRGGKIDGRSDLFSLGVVLYEALTGRKPFQAETLAAVLNAIMNSSPPPPHEVEASVPPELSAIVERAIARKPEERYARGKEMASELRRFLDTVRGVSAAASLTAQKERKSSWLVAVAAAIVALVALGSALLLRGKGGSSPRPGVGYLEFVSEPKGAEIFLDGNVVGRTPYTSEVTAGNHEIEFRKEGYYPATQSTTVEPNKRITIELPMLSR